MFYDSPRQLAAFLTERGLALKKRFGQNFLISPGARRKIVSLLSLEPGARVWEIGGGIGSLTAELCELAQRLVVFEIDHGFVRVLAEQFASRPGVEIVAGDYLKSWESVLEDRGRPDVIVGNLPYRSAAPIIATLLDWEEPVGRALFTVQREVGQRMAASPGTKEYSRFSMLCQAVFAVQVEGEVAAASFFPAPEVVSSIVSLVPNGMERDYDRELYRLVVHDLFAARRKTVRNNLLGGVIGGRFALKDIEQALASAAIDPASRGERLSVNEAVALTQALSARAPIKPGDGRKE